MGKLLKQARMEMEMLARHMKAIPPESETIIGELIQWSDLSETGLYFTEKIEYIIDGTRKTKVYVPSLRKWVRVHSELGDRITTLIGLSLFKS